MRRTRRRQSLCWLTFTLLWAHKRPIPARSWWPILLWSVPTLRSITVRASAVGARMAGTALFAQFDTVTRRLCRLRWSIGHIRAVYTLRPPIPLWAV